MKTEITTKELEEAMNAVLKQARKMEESDEPEERHRRRVKQNGTDDPERTSYTEAILRLLKAADLRKLRLVWVYASHLIR